MNSTPCAMASSANAAAHCQPRTSLPSHEIAAVNHPFVDDREPGLDFLWRQEMAFQLVAHRHALFALELCPPLRRVRDLDATDLVKTRLVPDSAAAEHCHCVLGELGHHLGIVGLKDEAGRMAGGAAGLKQWPLVNDGGVPSNQVGRDDRRRYSQQCQAPTMTTWA